MEKALERRHVVVLGGGIAGLVAAYLISREWGNRVEVTVVEKEAKLGGWLQSIPQLEGFCERGPRSFRGTGGETTLRLVYELGLQGEVLGADKKMSGSRFVLFNGKPCRMGAFAVMRSVGLWTVLRELFVPRRNHSKEEDESVDSFFRRRFNPRLAAIVGAVCSGIFAGDTRKLALTAVLPLLAELETRHGSIVIGVIRLVLSKVFEAVVGLVSRRGKGGAATLPEPCSSPEAVAYAKETGKRAALFTFKKGMQTLVRGLVDKTQATLLTSCSVERLDFTHSRATDRVPFTTVFVRNQANKVVELKAHHVICAIPARSLSAVLQESTVSSVSPAVDCAAMHHAASLLESIPTASVATVSLGLHHVSQPLSCPIPAKYRGFGYLVPPYTGEHILGAIMDSCTFPSAQPGNLTRLSVFIGGATQPGMLALGEEELVETAKEALSRHLGLSFGPNPQGPNGSGASAAPCEVVWSSVSLNWNCIPQYNLNHRKIIAGLEKALPEVSPQLSLAGASYYGIGVNDCVKRSFEVVQSLKHSPQWAALLQEFFPAAIPSRPPLLLGGWL
eukprot:RCo026828